MVPRVCKRQSHVRLFSGVKTLNAIVMMPRTPRNRMPFVIWDGFDSCSSIFVGPLAAARPFAPLAFSDSSLVVGYYVLHERFDGCPSLIPVTVHYSECMFSNGINFRV